MKNAEDILNVYDGRAYGPLADAALRRAATGSLRLDRLQHDALALTDGQLRYEVYRIIRYVTQGARLRLVNPEDARELDLAEGSYALNVHDGRVDRWAAGTTL